jgi:hypothetical protein
MGFDKRAYQCRIMREKRARERARIGLPPPGQGKRQWEMRAEEMHAIAEELDAEPRALIERLARFYQWLADQAPP